jgi:hypothetical protein
MPVKQLLPCIVALAGDECMNKMFSRCGSNLGLKCVVFVHLLCISVSVVSLPPPPPLPTTTTTALPFVLYRSWTRLWSPC